MASDPQGRTVLVTGATGRQGGATARRLVADGWTVRGLTRDASSDRAGALRATGVEVVEGDMGDRAALTRAITGAHGVFSVQNSQTAGVQQEVVQGRNVADVAAGAGVQHLVYASAGTGQRGTGIEQWESKLDIEEHVASVGIPHTVLRPLAFMELMTDKDFFPALAAWHMMPRLVGLERRLPWIAVDDVGVIAATAFARPEEFVGRQLAVAADVRTLAECRAAWQDLAGRAPRRVPVPRWLFERFAGKDLTRMWEWLRANPVEADVEATRAIHPGAASVREWIAARSTAA